MDYNDGALSDVAGMIRAPACSQEQEALYTPGVDSLLASRSSTVSMGMFRMWTLPEGAWAAAMSRPKAESRMNASVNAQLEPAGRQHTTPGNRTQPRASITSHTHTYTHPSTRKHGTRSRRNTATKDARLTE